jgi:hypothetical protein
VIENVWLVRSTSHRKSLSKLVNAEISIMNGKTMKESTLRL